MYQVLSKKDQNSSNFEDQKVEEFAHKINCWIDNSKEFQVDDEWSWGKIEPKFRNYEANTDTGKQFAVYSAVRLRSFTLIYY